MRINKKSQLIIYDFLFGFLSFIVIIALVSLMWFKTSSQASYDELEKDQIFYAKNLANQLVLTSGHPENWERDSNIYSNSNFTIGLALDNNILSQEKVDIFFGMNGTYNSYEDTKSLLRLQQYNYFIKLKDKDSTFISTGLEPTDNISVAVTRIVYLENESKELEIIIY